MFCFFIWLNSIISIVSRLFDLILRLLVYLGFLCFEGLSWLPVSISSNLFSVSISEICGLCLLDFFFQRNLFWGASSGFSVLSNFFGGRLLGFVMMGGMLGVCCSLGWVFGFFPPFFLFWPLASLLCGWRFYFVSGSVWGLVVKLVKLSLSNSSSVFNSFIKFILLKWVIIPWFWVELFVGLAMFA